MINEAKIKAIAPWFGGKRTMAPEIVAEMGPHTQFFEPFCGSMAVLFAKPPSQKETVCDLHFDLTNLARILQHEGMAGNLYHRLQSTLFSEDLLDQAREVLEVETMPDALVSGLPVNCNRAYWYFLASWMGRNGTAGTARIDYQMAVRWTKGGGSPTVRFRNAVDSIPWWHERLRNVVILRRDAFEIIDRFEDDPSTCVYADPPYPAETRSTGSIKNGRGGKYLHEFKHTEELLFGDTSDASRLADKLCAYKRARIIVSSYDCPQVRRLYAGWTFIDKTRQKHLHAQNGRGARPKEAPEVLIINGPSLDTAV